MRSTITLYADGSSIFVPPNFTISAVMPCGRPSWFTRSMKAGGKLYSRPHNKPIFTSHSSSVDAVAGFPDQVLHHCFEIAGLPEDGELTIGAGALRQHRMHVVDRVPAPELVEHVVDEPEQLERQIAHRHLGALAEVDQLSLEAPAGGPPLVLFDQRPAIQPEALVAGVELVQLDDNRLAQRGDHDRRFRLGGDVADPELEGAELRMRPHVPPDLGRVLDAMEIDQHLHVVLVGAPRLEVIR